MIRLDILAVRYSINCSVTIRIIHLYVQLSLYTQVAVLISKNQI